MARSSSPVADVRCVAYGPTGGTQALRRARSARRLALAERRNTPRRKTGRARSAVINNAGSRSKAANVWK